MKDREPTPRTHASGAPRLAGVRAGPALAGVLYALLVASAALALWGRRSPGTLPDALEAAAPWAFLCFVLCFAAYRFALVRAGKYSAFKAFFQVGAAVIFFTLLLPGTPRPAEPRGEVDLTALLRHGEAPVRILAAELARHREGADRYLPALAAALKDRDAAVRSQAYRSLVVISGEDLGGPEDEKAVKAWIERYR